MRDIKALDQLLRNREEEYDGLQNMPIEHVIGIVQARALLMIAQRLGGIEESLDAFRVNGLSGIEESLDSFITPALDRIANR